MFLASQDMSTGHLLPLADEDHLILFKGNQFHCTSPTQLPQVLFFVPTKIEGMFQLTRICCSSYNFGFGSGIICKHILQMRCFRAKCILCAVDGSQKQLRPFDMHHLGVQPCTVLFDKCQVNPGHTSYCGMLPNQAGLIVLCI